MGGPEAMGRSALRREEPHEAQAHETGGFHLLAVRAGRGGDGVNGSDEVKRPKAGVLADLAAVLAGEPGREGEGAQDESGVAAQVHGEEAPLRRERRGQTRHQGGELRGSAERGSVEEPRKLG